MADKEDTQELPSTPDPTMRVVYDKEGNKHTMTTLNAHDCIQHLGWTSHLGPVRETKGDVVVLVSKKSPPVDKDNSDQVNLSTMDQDELIAFAKEHFNMDFTKEVKAEDILAAILQEQE